MPAFVYRDVPFGAKGETNIQYVEIAPDGTIGDLQVIGRPIRVKVQGNTIQLRQIQGGAFRVKTSAGTIHAAMSDSAGSVRVQTSNGVKFIL